MSFIKTRQFFEEVTPICDGCDFQFITGQAEELMEAGYVSFSKRVKVAGTIYEIKIKSEDVGFCVAVIDGRVSLITDISDFAEARKMAQQELGIWNGR